MWVACLEMFLRCWTPVGWLVNVDHAFWKSACNVGVQTLWGMSKLLSMFMGDVHMSRK